MSIRTRLILTFLLIVGVGFYFFIDWVLDDLKIRYRESTEEPLVDTAYLLASLLSRQAVDGTVRIETFRSAFEKAHREAFSVPIHDLIKIGVDMRVYVTDDRGIVLYDSDGGRDEGKDYSNWNDVYLTLRGEYGARSTRRDPENPASTVFHVAAPIRDEEGTIIGVVTVCKPLANVNLFIRMARRNILIAGIAAALAVIILGILVSLFITRPIGKLTRYARSIRDGGRPALPRLGKNEIGELGEAMAEMREALEGKKYVEQYVQTLAHEIKSPLSAIRGAAELLEEEMPSDRRQRFIANIRTEEDRIRRMIERLLELASLENRQGLEKIEKCDPGREIEEVIESFQPLLKSGRIEFVDRGDTAVSIRGERFLIRQAIANLIQNALDFTPPGGTIRVALRRGSDSVSVVIEDPGPGIPDYARDKIFNKFYSLPRPGTGAKSTGLGLSFVKEVADLHGGAIALENLPVGGARAILTFPYLTPNA
ncbi:MAG: two-component system sensor histidine kinase CreC [PVC group bacterium]